MMRLIEQLEGTGSVSDRNRVLGDVRYHVRVYQQFHEPGQNLIQGERRIEGLVTAVAGSSFNVFGVWQRGADLVLRLEGGRALEFQIRSSDGSLIATSRFVDESPPQK